MPASVLAGPFAPPRNGGVWGTHEQYNFLQKEQLLDPEQRTVALQRLADGISSGRIRLQLRSSPHFLM